MGAKKQQTELGKLFIALFGKIANQTSSIKNLTVHVRFSSPRNRCSITLMKCITHQTMSNALFFTILYHSTHHTHTHSRSHVE